ncbi:MAG: DMT family transporter [Hylemonella sp.]|nr:DMT family transporter [Hylemonella sp.]
MQTRLTSSTALLLTLPPLMWAGNAVVGRMAAELVPPMMLNLLRWALAGLILLPLAAWVLRRDSGLWQNWRRFSMLGLVSVGAYNALQYLALKTSSPINVTLVAASMPIWMQLIGRLFFAAPVSRRQLLGALLSISGVLLVLSRGQLQTLLQVQLLPGDIYILIAAVCWAFYSWMLARPGGEPDAIRSDWAAFLLAQIVFGLAWSALFAAGEWAVVDQPIVWGWPLLLALVFVAVGPALLAYRAWDIGVRRAGPTVASFFGNLTPLLAALMSAALLGELPQLYHGAAFVLIVCGIVVSSARR